MYSEYDPKTGLTYYYTEKDKDDMVPVKQTVINNTQELQKKDEHIISPIDESEYIKKVPQSNNFPSSFTLNETVKYDINRPFDEKIDYDIRGVLVNMDVYTSRTEHFNIKLRDIFTDYILVHKKTSEMDIWLGSPNIRYWDQQLNFAVWVATSGCGISIKDHLLNDTIPPQIRSFCRFHVYYTIRRILYELGGIQAVHALPSDSVFNRFDNPYDEASYHRICDEFGIKYGTDFRFLYDTDGNHGLGDQFIWESHHGPSKQKGIYNGSKFFNQDVGFDVDTPFGKRHHMNTPDSRAHWFKFQNDDYKPYNYFIPVNGRGLTKAGLTRLNQSIEAYVYCILGSQANTRSSIIGSSGSAQETRREFLNLLEDKSSGVIINRDIVDSIQRFQDVIDSTNVKLDLAISPSLWLLPSKMIINTQTNIAGYNNFLQQATDNMNFGYNNINNDVKKSALLQMEGHDDPIERGVEPLKITIIDNNVQSTIENDPIHDYTMLGLLVGTLFLSYMIF